MIKDMLLADLVNELPAAVRAQRLVSALQEHFCCGAVGLLRLEGENLRPVAMEGLVPEVMGRQFSVAEHPRLARILEHRQVTRFEPGTDLPDPYDGLLASSVGLPLPVHDCMGVSLYVEGQLWGAITLDSLHPGAFGSACQNDLARFTLLIEATVRVSWLEEEYRRLKAARFTAPGMSEPPPPSDLLGQSEIFRQRLQELDIAAASDLPVLLTGETGVGKELFARRLHLASGRRQQPLIQVNCAALPESLAEGELFGHAKGAFSGAVTSRMGRIEAAQGGTLFLDEVGELPLSIQAKLLRTLQSGEIQRLGEDRTRQVDVRIVAATNRPLKDSVAEGQFRADLYHRLSVYPIPVPPLRERGTDVLLLAGHFLELNRSRLGLRSLRLSPEAEVALMHYEWPGNVRELEHAISRAALKAASRYENRQAIITITTDLLGLEEHPLVLTGGLATVPDVAPHEPLPIVSLRESVEAIQRLSIRNALNQTEGNWSEAARRLEMDPSNLHKLAKRLGLRAV